MTHLRQPAIPNLGSKLCKRGRLVRVSCTGASHIGVEKLLLDAGAVLNVRVEQTEHTGLGLAWRSQEQTTMHMKNTEHAMELLVAQIPVTHILYVGNAVCQAPKHVLPKQLKRLLYASRDPLDQTVTAKDNLSDNSTPAEWDLKLAALLVWVLSQGDNYLNGFWCQYARELLPKIEQPISLLTFNAHELQYLQNAGLKHSAIAWQREVQNVYKHYIAPWQPSQVLPETHEGDAHNLCQRGQPATDNSRAIANGNDNSNSGGYRIITSEIYQWAVALVASRAYGLRTDDSQRLHVFAPIWGEANHNPTADTVSRWLMAEELADNNIQGEHVALYLRLPQASTDDRGAGSGSLTELPTEGAPCFTNYGEKCNRQLMQQYGFVLNGNPNEGLIFPVTLQHFLPVIQTAARTRVVWHHLHNDIQETMGRRRGPSRRRSRPYNQDSKIPGCVGGMKLLRRDRITRALQNVITSHTSQGNQSDSQQPTTIYDSHVATMCHESLLQGLLKDAQRQIVNSLQDTKATTVALQAMLAPFFSNDAKIRRLKAVARRLADTYGCRNLAEYRAVTMQAELAAVQQALLCMQARVLLSVRPSIRPCDGVEDLFQSQNKYIASNNDDQVKSVPKPPVITHSDDASSVTGSVVPGRHMIVIHRELLQQIAALLKLELETKEHPVAAKQVHARPAAVRAGRLYCMERYLVDLAAVELLHAIQTDLLNGSI